MYTSHLILLGMVAQIPPEFFAFLKDVQDRLASVIKSIGKIEHSLYPFKQNYLQSRKSLTNSVKERLSLYAEVI